MVGEDHAAIGALAAIEDTLEQLLREVRRPRDWGGVDHVEAATWPAGQSYTYTHDGSFLGVMVINESDADVYVSFTPNGGVPSAAGVARENAITLEARAWLTLPIRASVVDVGGASAGRARIIPLAVAPATPAMGVAGGEGGGIYSLTPGTYTDQQAAPLAIDARGNLRVSLWAPGGAGAVAANGIADANSGSALVPASTVVYNGATYDRARTPTVFKIIQNVAVVAGTPQAVWTPAAGKKFRLMGFALSLSVAGRVLLKDQGTEIARTPDMAAAIGLASPPMGNGILSTVANQVLQVDVSAGGNVNGFVFGTEE
jgi:hypothetical protein